MSEYDDGYDRGYNDGYDSGFACGREELLREIDDLRTEVHTLESELSHAESAAQDARYYMDDRFR